MLIQYCLKGIPEQAGVFDDGTVSKVLAGHGLSAAWLRSHQHDSCLSFPDLSHLALSQNALNAHVNSFGSVHRASPFLSLSAGCVELDPTTATARTYSALQTALDFATNGGRQSGYVLRMWVLVSPKPAPELPGFAEEVRDLNLFRQYTVYHHEGEIAAKLFVPARQIERVEKFDHALNLLRFDVNAEFVAPERLSNVMEMV
jgi:hypothetical protein